MPEILAPLGINVSLKELSISSVLQFDSALEFVSLLDMPNVRIKDRATVDAKLRMMTSDGPDKLMVISDFDFTLSKFDDVDGKRFWSSPGVFDHLANETMPELGTKFKELCRKYIPIEFDPHLTMEEKIPHMEDFWRISHKLTIDAGFHKQTIENFVRRSNIVLRDGCDHWMKHLVDLDVPLVIFSAGVGDVIDVFLQKILNRPKLPQNMHIISNMMEYDDQEKLVAFSEPLIHTFCKNSSVIQKEASFFHQIADRTNVLLLGDSLGDIHMDVGVERAGPTLKIGFLNYKVDELLPHFMEIYDIVLVEERSMKLPAAILSQISETTL